MKRNPPLSYAPIRNAAKIDGAIDFPLIPQRTQWTCGPAVACAIARYFGYKVKETTFAITMGTTRKCGTKPDRLAWALVDFCRPHMREGATITSIKKAIDRGIPVIILWNDWGGHWAVCVGYDKKHILLADPANRKSGLRLHRTNDFIKHWKANIFGNTYHKLAIFCPLC